MFNVLDSLAAPFDYPFVFGVLPGGAILHPVLVGIAVLGLSALGFLWWRHRCLLKNLSSQRTIERCFRALSQLSGNTAEEVLEHAARATGEAFEASDACYWVETPSKYVRFVGLKIPEGSSPLRDLAIERLSEVVAKPQVRSINVGELTVERRVLGRPDVLVIPVPSGAAHEAKVLGGILLWWQDSKQLRSFSIAAVEHLGMYVGLVADHITLRALGGRLQQTIEDFPKAVAPLPNTEQGKALVSLIARNLQTFTSAKAALIYVHSPDVKKALLVASPETGDDCPLVWASKNEWAHALARFVGIDTPIVGDNLRRIIPQEGGSTVPKVPFTLAPLPKQKREGTLLIIEPRPTFGNIMELSAGLAVVTAIVTPLLELGEEGGLAVQATVQTLRRFAATKEAAVMLPRRIDISWPAQDYIPLIQLLTEKKLKESELLAYIEQTAETLVPLHSRGQTACLNPNSILIDPVAKTVKLAPYPVNWDLAPVYFEGLSAPEILQRKFSPQSDLFFLGALIFFFYMGRFPPSDHSLPAVLANLYVPGGALGIDYLLKRSLWFSPSGRPRDASEFVFLLREIIRRHSLGGQTPATRFNIGADLNVGINKGRNRGYQATDNEDSLFWDSDQSQHLCLMAIADGVTRSDIGTGKEAADLFIAEASSLWQNYCRRPPSSPEEVVSDLTSLLNQAAQNIVGRANEYLRRSPKTLQRIHPLSTAACVAVGFKGEGIVASVGNVRSYLVFNDCVAQLTPDDTPIAEAVLNPELPYSEVASSSSSMLTQVVGQAEVGINGLKPEPINPHLQRLTFYPGDTLVLVSDGAFSYEAADRSFEEELLAIIRTSSSPQLAAFRVIAFANERGGHDNVSCIIARAEK